MDRRAFIGTVAGGLLAAPLAAWAQPAGKVWRIGLLSNGIPQTGRAPAQKFLQGLRELGIWMEGRDFGPRFCKAELAVSMGA